MPPDVSSATSIFFGMMAADGGARARDDLAAAKGSHTGQMRALLDALESEHLDASGYFALFRRWAALRALVRGFLASYDVVLAPVTVGPAPLHGCTPGTDVPLESYDVFNLTHTYSVAGLPVAVVPIGTDGAAADRHSDRRESISRPGRAGRRGDARRPPRGTVVTPVHA